MLDNLELIGTGFAVVLMALAFIWAASAFVGYFFIQAERKAAAASAAAAAAPAIAPQVAQAAAAPLASGVPAHHMAAISAAIAHTLGGGYRIMNVAAPAHKVSEWPLEGRIETFTAHRVRTNWGLTRPLKNSGTPNSSRGK